MYLHHSALLNALGHAVGRASDVTVEACPNLTAARELRLNDPALPGWARDLLTERGWRSAFAVPLDDHGHALLASDFQSMRRWSRSDRALCELIARAIPRPAFTEQLRAALADGPRGGHSPALLLVDSDAPAIDLAAEVSTHVDRSAIVGPLDDGRCAVCVVDGDLDATVERIERGLALCGVGPVWFGYAEASAGEHDPDAMLDRARGCLAGARRARVAAYHGLLPRLS